MAALKPEVRAFIIQELACFDTPSQIVESVQKEFKVQVTRQQVASHASTGAAGGTSTFTVNIAPTGATNKDFTVATTDATLSLIHISEPTRH